MFIQQGKTNWGFLAVFTLITCAVGGSLMYYIGNAGKEMDSTASYVELNSGKYQKSQEKDLQQNGKSSDTITAAQKENAYDLGILSKTGFGFRSDLQAYYDFKNIWQYIEPEMELRNISGKQQPFISENGWGISLPPSWRVYSASRISWVSEAMDIHFYDGSVDAAEGDFFRSSKGEITISSHFVDWSMTPGSEADKLETLALGEGCKTVEHTEFLGYPAVKCKFMQSDAYYKNPANETERIIFRTSDSWYDIFFGSLGKELEGKKITEYENYPIYQEILASFKFYQK